jgi:hypothetical protein
VNELISLLTKNALHRSDLREWKRNASAKTLGWDIWGIKKACFVVMFMIMVVVRKR